MNLGIPNNWQISFQKAFTPAMKQIIWLQHYSLLILLPIVIIIPIIIIYICFKYNDNNNHKPSKIEGNIFIEILWTLIPILILTLIAIPSLNSLKYQINQKKKPYITIKIIAHQWYWNYEYNIKNIKFNYDSNMLKETERNKFNKTNLNIYPRLLAVNNELVIPSKKVIKFIITSADVIHSFAVPSLGIKIDAIPGKINDFWTKINHSGLYYGQCSELCGKDHAFMPISIKVISQESFNNWVNFIPISIKKAFDSINNE